MAAAKLLGRKKNVIGGQVRGTRGVSKNQKKNAVAGAHAAEIGEQFLPMLSHILGEAAHGNESCHRPGQAAAGGSHLAPGPPDLKHMRAHLIDGDNCMEGAWRSCRC